MEATTNGVIVVPELKTNQIVVNVEPTIHELTREASWRTRQSISAYVRALIVTDLTQRKLLTVQLLQQMATAGGDV